MLNKISNNRAGRLMTAFLAAIFSGVLILSLTGFVQAEVETLTLSVDMTTSGDPVAGGTIKYTIDVSSSGSGAATFELENTLPANLTYVADSLTASPDGLTVSESGGVISSDPYALNTGGSAQISFHATIDEAANIGDNVVNTVSMNGTEVIDNAPFSDSDTVTLTVVEQTDPVDLFVSKMASTDEALPGETFQYTIMVTTSADAPRGFVLTDTLPAGVTFVDGSISSSTGLNVSEAGGELTSATFFLNSGQSAQTSFSVVVDVSTPISTVITNTVMMYDISNDLLLDASAGTMVVTKTNTTLFMPFIALPYEAPTNNAITAPTGVTNTWTVTWEDLHTANTKITGYEVEESTDPNFAAAATTSTSVGKVTSLAVSKPVDNQTTFYYRVRSVIAGEQNGASDWSNTQAVTSIYFFAEDFNDDANPGNWKIVRQDTDDIINKLSVNNGYLDLRMESRFDYMIASNLTRVPENGNFKITARMRLEDADPRHAGGIILGGDYDGTSACPESVDADNPENSKYNTCFTEYYRFMFIAGNVSNQFTTQVKRIEEHSDTNNSGGGTELASKTFISDKGRKNWIDWTVEVFTDGTMKLYLGDDLIHEVQDTTYQDNKYFGFWSSTSDTTFSNTQIDWVNVRSIE